MHEVSSFWINIEMTLKYVGQCVFLNCLFALSLLGYQYLESAEELYLFFIINWQKMKEDKYYYIH